MFREVGVKLFHLGLCILQK